MTLDVALKEIDIVGEHDPVLTFLGKVLKGIDVGLDTFGKRFWDWVKPDSLPH